MTRIIYLETCLPDYFNGFAGTVFSVPVTALTTKAELREQLIADINASISDEDPFDGDADMERAVDTVMENFLVEHPFAEVGADLDMPTGYFAVRNDDSTWSLYEGDEDDMENADLVEDNLPSRAGALVEAHQAECTLEMDVHCYFGLQQEQD